MKVILNIESDKELRTAVKDAIKGQVLSIIRGEIKKIITDEIERKLKGTDQLAFDQMIKQAIFHNIGEILRKEHSVTRWNTEFIKPYIEIILNDVLKDKDWKSIVDKLAKEKIESLL